MRPRVLVLSRAVTVGAFACGVLVGGAPIASADTPPPCTAAELARVSSGVSMATADYLTANQSVNDFFTSLKGQDSDTLRVNVENYLNANPVTRDQLQGLRQPLAEFESRCL